MKQNNRKRETFSSGPVAYLCEEKGMNRNKAVLFTAGIIILIGTNTFIYVIKKWLTSGQPLS